jgi:hypothetical protein
VACNCGKRRQTATPKRIAGEKQTIPVGGDTVTLLYNGETKDVFYGVYSGNRYAVLPGETIEVDKADLETGLIHRPGMLENGNFTTA